MSEVTYDGLAMQGEVPVGTWVELSYAHLLIGKQGYICVIAHMIDSSVSNYVHTLKVEISTLFHMCDSPGYLASHLVYNHYGP